jgi:large subunit ribosomal protein L24
MHVKQGDTVVVISGVKDKDKNKKGKILKAFPKTERVIVEGVNIRKKHLKPTREMQQAGIIDQEGSVHVSNVLLIAKNAKKACGPVQRSLPTAQRCATAANAEKP